MKTVYKLFHATVLTLCSAIMLSSCDSFLDTKPYDFTAPETFYSNESECTAALAGVYYTLVYEKVYMGHRTKRVFQWSGKMGERF